MMLCRIVMTTTVMADRCGKHNMYTKNYTILGYDRLRPSRQSQWHGWRLSLGRGRLATGTGQCLHSSGHQALVSTGLVLSVALTVNWRPRPCQKGRAAYQIY